jgi:hypothetical protein
MQFFFKNVKPMDIIFVGGLCGALCAILVIYGTWKHNKQSSEKSTRIETGVNKANEEVTQLKVQNDSLKAISEMQLNKIDELRQENEGLYLKLANSTREIYNNVTGGGNAPILIVGASQLNVSESKPSYYMIQFIVKNKGKYPIKDLIIKISDFTGREMLKYNIKQFVDGTVAGLARVKDGEYENYEFNKTFRHGTVSPNMAPLIYRTTYSPELSSMPPFYNVELTWDNGHFLHMISLKSAEGKLKLDEITTLLNGREIKEKGHFKFE